MKKTILGLLSIALITFSCEQKVENTDSTKEVSNGVQNFGAEITEEGAIPASELLTSMEGKDSLRVKLSGTIDEVCQKKGCWMDVAMDEEGENFLFVKFKDYEFFVPKDAGGQEVIMEGVAYLDTTSIEELKHYAEDAGEPDSVINAITEPEIGYNFMADGVIVKDKE